MRWAMASTIGGGQQNHSHSCEFKITGGDRMNQALEMARVAYQALDEKKGEDIRVIDISGISVCDGKERERSGRSRSKG